MDGHQATVSRLLVMSSLLKGSKINEVTDATCKHVRLDSQRDTSHYSNMYVLGTYYVLDMVLITEKRTQQDTFLAL